MIKVQREDFDLGQELAALTAGRRSVGGLAVFVGLVRDMTGPASETPLSAMTLEHYPGMTERMLERIEAEAAERWPLEATLIIHRYGRLEPGEQIVLVACTSLHRDAAFDACRFLIDWLKTKAPFWKREESPTGDTWVEARESDDAAAAQWQARDPRRASG